MESTATTTTTDTRPDVYGIITEKIIEQLNNGIVPWQKPWTEAGLPKNVISGKHYRGINLMLLAMNGYEHNLYLSFKQVHEIGGKVKRDERGHKVVYWRQVDDTRVQQDGSERKKISILRYYTVFNISQCENIPEKYLPRERETTELVPCEAIVNGMPNRPTIRHIEHCAYYDPLLDMVNMPKKKSFKTDAGYYSTLFHELLHSTGHPLRLDRKGFVQMSERDGETYSHEELVAEIGTCYLQSVAGITSEFRNSAAYINGWLGKLKNDRRFIFTAASAAQKAVDFILGNADMKDEHMTEDIL